MLVNNSFMPKQKIATPSDSTFGLKVLIVIFLALGGWFLLTKFGGKSIQQAPKVVQSVAQLSSSTKKYSGMGTATKSHDDSSSQISVTAFLPKLPKGRDYYVFLKGNGADLKDMLLGKMVLSGDVYGLNYAVPNTSLYSYKSLVVVEETEAQAQAGKMVLEVLSGSFSE